MASLIRCAQPYVVRSARSLIIEIVLFWCFVFLLSSCSKHQELDVRRSFRYNETGGLKSLDPALASYQAAGWLTSQLFSTLVEYDSTLTLTPSVAKRWSVDSTGCRWIFELRTDVFFHEDSCFGAQRWRVLTAHDVRYSLERLLHAATRSPGLWVLRKRLVGGDEYHRLSKQAGFFGRCKGIEVLSDSTIALTLVKPFAPFLSLLTMPYCSIVPHEALEMYGEDFGLHPVGSGPFTMASWEFEKELVLRKNTSYFKTDGRGVRLPYLDNVTVQFIRDSKTEFLEFRNGNIDAVMQIDPSFASVVLNTDGTLQQRYAKYVLQQKPAHTIEYYGMLLDTNEDAARAMPLATSRFIRQALNYAIDRDRIVRYVLRGKGIAAEHGVLPPSMPGFSETVRGYTYNPAKARMLLKEAGFTNGIGMPTLTLQMGNNARSASVGEAIQQMWKEIGVSVTLKQVDFPQHLDMVR
ncbi:MAG: ABC transporter substrate-binding protein, partial [Candidatus Kapabacteria bacterium]|nr:ABC transporter substrate-binding protein [Candidatus Kapabacteria bacterium]